MSLWKLLILIFPLLGVARTSHAKDGNPKELAAKTACLAGDYAKGSALLAELYVASNDPVYLYNQGRCFEQNHRYADAISRFQEFLRVGKQLGKEAKADAQTHIDECQAFLVKEREMNTAGEKSGQESGNSAKEKAAKKACLTGDADTGVALLADLYVDTNNATHIFNQGRCLEQAGRCADAIIRFREYLRKVRNAGLADDGRAERHIADCEGILKKNQEAVGTSPPTITVQPAISTAPVSQSLRGQPLRVAGMVTFGVGLAGLATGFGLAGAANRLADQLEESPSSYSRSTESKRYNYATASAISYAAGAACVAGGVLLYTLGVLQGRDSSPKVEPMVSAQSAGASVRVVF